MPLRWRGGAPIMGTEFATKRGHQERLIYHREARKAYEQIARMVDHRWVRPTSVASRDVCRLDRHARWRRDAAGARRRRTESDAARHRVAEPAGRPVLDEHPRRSRRNAAADRRRARLIDSPVAARRVARQHRCGLLDALSFGPHDRPARSLAHRLDRHSVWPPQDAVHGRGAGRHQGPHRQPSARLRR